MNFILYQNVHLKSLLNFTLNIKAKGTWPSMAQRHTVRDVTPEPDPLSQEHGGLPAAGTALAHFAAGLAGAGRQIPHCTLC